MDDGNVDGAQVVTDLDGAEATADEGRTDWVGKLLWLVAAIAFLAAAVVIAIKTFIINICTSPAKKINIIIRIKNDKFNKNIKCTMESTRYHNSSPN